MQHVGINQGFLSALGGTEKIAGLWFARRYQCTDWDCGWGLSTFTAHIKSLEGSQRIIKFIAIILMSIATLESNKNRDKVNEYAAHI